MIRLWRDAWTEFIPFLDYDIEIRRVICSTNAIKSLIARSHPGVWARGHCPPGQTAVKCLYVVTRSLDPKGTGKTLWARWNPALRHQTWSSRRARASVGGRCWAWGDRQLVEVV